MKINCIIVDDEPENLKYLQQIVEDIDDVEIIRSFTDGSSFLEGIKSLKFEMCILDNRLPDISGVECARALKDKKIIFVSAHELPADVAFDLNAIDVLRKPVTKERLELAVKKCRNKIVNDKGYVFIKTSALGKMRFKLDDIVYIKTDENPQYKIIVTKEGEEIKTQKYSLEDLMNRLPDEQYIVISKKEILNSTYFRSFKGKDLILLNHFTMINGKKKDVELTVSEKCEDALKSLVGYY